jgi:two-component system nitrate/nitrite response regulator NarL
LVESYENIRENIRAGVVFIDQPDLVRAIRAVAPHAHIVVLPSDALYRSLSTKNGVAARVDPKPATLTRREHTVLARVATGETNAEIAAAMGLAPNTVKAYLQSLMRKLGARNRVEALACARTYGIV